MSDAAATDKRNNMAKQAVFNTLAANTNAESQAMATVFSPLAFCSAVRWLGVG